jgi:FtsP/CotA-like multicopper oxidase with cupredoxin domain
MNNQYKPNRRSVLLGAAALTIPSILSGQQSFTVLEPMLGTKQILPIQYPQTKIWGYGGTSPGQEIRVVQGQRVQRRLLNSMDQPTSIHWHGIRIDNAMDGVPDLTQSAVAPGETFDYDFVAPDAGTYWYHSHFKSTEQVERGLYGALIIEEAVAQDIDREEVLILDDWLMQETGEINPDFEASHDRSHAGRNGNFITTNSQYQPVLSAKKNERLRLRLINAANARIFPLGLQGLTGWVMAYDGMPLAVPEPIKDILLLAPAQRMDIIVDVIAEEGEMAMLVWAEPDQPQVQVGFEVTGTASSVARPAPTALPPNSEMSTMDMSDPTVARLVMAGGAMGNLREAELDGQTKNFRQIAASNQYWAFNGVVGMTDNPLVDVSVGETVRLKIDNETVFPHAMHLHGQHFREVLADGKMGPMRDTLLVGGRASTEIAFVATNPGKWLYHCHMLSHQDAGMKTWMNVRA